MTTTHPTPSKPTLSDAQKANVIGALTLVASCVAALTGIAAVFYNARQANLSHAGLRPLVTLPEIKSNFTGSTVKVELDLYNAGKSTASLDGVEWVVAKQGELEYSYKIPNTAGTVIAPGDHCRRTMTVSRSWESNGIAYDLSKGVDLQGKMIFRVRYSSMELEGESYSNSYIARFGEYKPNRDE